MPEIDGLQMSRMIKKQLIRLRNPTLERSISPNDSTSDLSKAIARIIPECPLDQNFDTLIYAVTAMNDEQINEIYDKYGIEEVMAKPVNTEILRPIIDKIFSN